MYYWRMVNTGRTTYQVTAVVLSLSTIYKSLYTCNPQCVQHSVRSALQPCPSSLKRVTALFQVRHIHIWHASIIVAWRLSGPTAQVLYRGVSEQTLF